MAEIQKVTMWAWRDAISGAADFSRPPRAVRSGYWYKFPSEEREYGWIVPVEVVANTPENIEAIRDAAAKEMTGYDGAVFRDLAREHKWATNSLLAVLGLTGGGDEG